MMTIAKKSLPLSLGKGRLPVYGLQATFPKADETVKSTPNRDKFTESTPIRDSTQNSQYSMIKQLEFQIRNLRFYISLFFLFMAMTSFAQEQISGIVVDDNSKPIEFATILQLSADSTAIEGTVRQQW